MGYIPQSFIDELLARVDIVELVDGYVPLKKQGANYKARCPFHQEDTPSFNVNPDRQIYHCFGCGVGGNAIGFLIEYEHLRFPEAVHELARRYGLTVPKTAGGDPTVSREWGEGADTPLLQRINERACRYFEYQLRHHPVADRVQGYLQERGLSGSLVARFRLGFAPEGWRNLVEALGQDTQTAQALEDLGLIIRQEGRSPYDRFRGRLMFPIRDRQGRVVAFGGRMLEAGEPKYLNSPEGPLFHKGRILYGFYEADKALRREQQAVVVEGYMDVLALAQAGVDNAVAPLGTAVTSEQLRLLLRAVPEVVCCFDGDEAGRKAAWRAVETALPEVGRGRWMRFAFLPEGEDPDSLVRGEGKQAFEGRISKAEPLFEFLITGLKERVRERVELGSPEGRASLLELAKPYFDLIEDETGRHFFIQRLDSLVKLGETQVARQLGRRGNTKRSDPKRPSNNPDRRGIDTALHRQPVARQALVLLLGDPHRLVEEVLTFREALMASRDPIVQLLLRVADTIQQDPELSVSSLVERLRGTPDGEVVERLAGEELPFIPEEGRQAQLQGCMRKLQAHAIQARLDALEEEARSGSLEAIKWQEFQQLKRQWEALTRAGYT